MGSCAKNPCHCATCVQHDSLKGIRRCTTTFVQFVGDGVHIPVRECIPRFLSITYTHGFPAHQDFVAAIEYIPPTLVLQAGLLPTGTFQVSFSRISPDGSKSVRAVTGAPLPNPHQEIASYLSPRLIEGNSEQTRQAVQEFVLVCCSTCSTPQCSVAEYMIRKLLRSTLPVLQELESIRENAALARRKSLACLKVSVVYKSAAWFRILYGITWGLFAPSCDCCVDDFLLFPKVCVGRARLSGWGSCHSRWHLLPTSATQVT